MHNTVWEGEERFSSSSNPICSANRVATMQPSLWYSLLQPHFLSFFDIYFYSNRPEKKISRTRNLPNPISKVCRRLDTVGIASEGLAARSHSSGLSLKSSAVRAGSDLAHQVGGQGSGSFLLWSSWLCFGLWRPTGVSSPSQLSRSCQRSEDAPAPNIARGPTHTFAQKGPHPVWRREGRDQGRPSSKRTFTVSGSVWGCRWLGGFSVGECLLLFYFLLSITFNDIFSVFFFFFWALFVLPSSYTDFIFFF